MEWIKCSDQMPGEDIEECIVFDYGKVYYAIHWISEGEHHFITKDDEAMRLPTVSHWIPIPKPPVKE